MRTRSYIRIGLYGLLVLWMAAVSVAPLWHTGHGAPPVPEGVPDHDHRAGVWVCDARPESVDLVVDCVLCQAQRLLSQCWTRVPATSTTSHAATAPVSSARFIPRAGTQVPPAARAPPLC